LNPPNNFKRILEKDFFVYSFYEYEQIKKLINSKYEFYGDKVFNILANLSFKTFGKNFKYENIIAIPIDDHTRHQFSHSAILTKSLKSDNITPIYSTLKATNIVKYAGKDLKFRQTHKRNFKYSCKANLKVILVDDIITTGSTILEAREKLLSYNCEVLFALTLAMVSN
jgi:competence protein ComFC